MKTYFIPLIIFLSILTSCSYQNKAVNESLATIQFVDKNGFQETISSPDRLVLYNKTNFLSAQPFEKITRIYTRNHLGQIPSKLISYHDNGQPFRYLDVLNGRACGVFKEWHANGLLRLDALVIEGQGSLNDEAQLGWVFDGVCKAFDDQGHLLAAINYEKGVLQGNANYYRQNKQLLNTIPYEKGQIHGIVLSYDVHGKVNGKMSYVSGLKEGIAFFAGDDNKPPYSEEYQQDSLIKATYHNFSGESVGKIENGGGKKPYFENRSIVKIEEFQRGKPCGEVKLFFQNGKVQSQYNIDNGVKHGPEWVYFEDSIIDHKPKLYMEWFKGNIQGICRSWYKNGNLQSERELNGNQKHGICTAWYEDGSLMLTEEYEHDLLVKGYYLKKGNKEPVSTVEKGCGDATFYEEDGSYRGSALYKDGKIVSDE